MNMPTPEHQNFVHLSPAQQETATITGEVQKEIVVLA